MGQKMGQVSLNENPTVVGISFNTVFGIMKIIIKKHILGRSSKKVKSG